MYAVIKTGGKQYRVKPGDMLVVEKLPGEAGAEVSFDQVLMVGEGDSVTVGAPLVDGASVTATLVETRKGEKIKIFKKIRRQGYRRTRGHRQTESVLRVTAVAGAGMTEKWDGTVDLTTRAVLNARARGLTQLAESLSASSSLLPVAETASKPSARKPASQKPKAAPAEAAPAEVAQAPAAEPAAVEAAPEAPAKTAAAPKAAAPKPATPKAVAPKAPAPKAPAPKAAAPAKKAAAPKPAASKTSKTPPKGGKA